MNTSFWHKDGRTFLLHEWSDAPWEICESPSQCGFVGPCDTAEDYVDMCNKGYVMSNHTGGPPCVKEEDGTWRLATEEDIAAANWVPLDLQHKLKK